MRMKMMTVSLVAVMLALGGTANATSVVEVDVDDNVYQTTAGGQTLYWYMALEDSAAGSDAERADQIAFADSLSIDVSGVGIIDSWRMADVDDMEALLGQGGLQQATDRGGNPLWNKDGTPVMELSYPNAPVDDIIAAVVTPTDWCYDLGHFYGRYTDPDNPTAMLGFERSLLTWSIDRDTYTTPDFSSNDYKGAWIVADAPAAVPEPMTMAGVGMALVGVGGYIVLRRTA